MFEKKERYHLPHPSYRKFYDQIEVFQGERNVTIPLHSIDINVKGDRICKPTHAQETQDKNEDFESQGNANDSQDQPIPNVPKVQRNPNVVNLSQEDMKLLSGNSRQPLVVNLPISPTTPSHGNHYN